MLADFRFRPHFLCWTVKTRVCFPVFRHRSESCGLLHHPLHGRARRHGGRKRGVHRGELHHRQERYRLRTCDVILQSHANRFELKSALIGQLSHRSSPICFSRLRLHLLPRRGERVRTEPRRNRPLQTQRGHRVPGRQEQATGGGGA